MSSFLYARSGVVALNRGLHASTCKRVPAHKCAQWYPCSPSAFLNPKERVTQTATGCVSRKSQQQCIDDRMCIKKESLRQQQDVYRASTAWHLFSSKVYALISTYKHGSFPKQTLHSDALPCAHAQPPPPLHNHPHPYTYTHPHPHGYTQALRHRPTGGGWPTFRARPEGPLPS